MKKVAIIGGGNLGTAICLGLIKSGKFAASDIVVTRRHTDKLSSLAAEGVQTTADNCAAVAQSDIVIVCVKPKKIIEVLEQIAPSIDESRHILASVVTGVSIADMRASLQCNVPVFRVMPNTAIAIQESMTFVATDSPGTPAAATIDAMFKLLGDVIPIDEELMQAGTVLGACGIAFALRFIRAAQQGGIQIGFDAETSQRIAAQTVKGAAALIIERGLHPEREIDKVTTPQGITIEGLNEMEHQGFSSALIKGITTSYNKIGKK